MEELLPIISIFLGSTLKIILGITGGYFAGLSLWLTILLTAGGMMTSVVVFTYFGTWLKKRVLNRIFRRKFSRRTRRWVRTWRKYGMPGVAFFTPIVFMPIPGTLIATSFGTPKRKIMVQMLISIVLWTTLLTWLFFTFADLLVPLIKAR